MTYIYHEMRMEVYKYLHNSLTAGIHKLQSGETLLLQNTDCSCHWRL